MCNNGFYVCSMKNYNWSNLSVQQKINVKQYAINLYGKRWHTSKPNFCSKLNYLEIYSILHSQSFSFFVGWKGGAGDMCAGAGAIRVTGAGAGRYCSSTTSWSWGWYWSLTNSQKIRKKYLKKSKDIKKKTTFCDHNTTVLATIALNLQVSKRKKNFYYICRELLKRLL